MKSLIFCFKALLFILITTFYSCKKNTELPDLLGFWEGEKYSYDLTFLPNRNFTYSNYHIEKSDTLGYSIIRGNVKLEGKTLQFTVNEHETWDSIQYPGLAPRIEKKASTLFDNCTFTLKGRKLELTYLSYPNDAPMLSNLTFIKK